MCNTPNPIPGHIYLAKGISPARRQMERRYIVAKRRTEQGKIIRQQYRGDAGVPYQLVKGYALMLGGYANTITTYTTDNWIMELNENNNMEEPTYHEHPTKEQLLEYFGPRIRIRKMTPKTAFRLQDVSDEDIEKIQAYPFKTYAEREEATAKADKKELARIKRESICKTAQFRLVGNSITVNVLTQIFRTLFLPDQPENAVSQPAQLSLFD